MPKQNSAILLNRYIWLIDTIYSAGSISREEIDRRWCRSLLSEGEMCIPERTFHRYKDAIQELFQIIIDYSPTKGYYIENTEAIKRDGIRRWLMSTFSVNNLINEGANLRKHISFEDIPSGQQFLSVILEAIRERTILIVSHRGFNKEKTSTFKIRPYGLKIFKQRWYVLAESEYQDHRLLVYSLDRFEKVEHTEEKYEIPKDFDIEDYFASSYGVTGVKGKPELVKLWVDASQVNYFRTLPLHRSQSEEEISETGSVLNYYIIPTYEFRQEILSHGSHVEVLSPEHLRNEIAEEIRKMNEKYK